MSTTALPTFTAPFATVPATPIAADPAETPTLTAVPATDTAVDATETATQPAIDITTAMQVLPRTNLVARIDTESGGRSRAAIRHGELKFPYGLPENLPRAPIFGLQCAPYFCTASLFVQLGLRALVVKQARAGFGR